MSPPDRAARRLGLLYDLTAVATMGGIMLFTFAGVDAGLYAAAGLGAAASLALGYRSLRARSFTIGRGTARYAKLWLLMTLVSGFTLVNGRWQPIAIFALTGGVMLLCYAVGGWLGARSAGAPQP